MNRSILIVICDFLLLSLLTFSTDLNKIAGQDENAPLTIKADLSSKSAENNSRDLAAVMKLALVEEQRNREMLQTELAQTRAAVQQQSALLSRREQEARQLQQQQAALQQQYAAAKTNIQTLSQQLKNSSTEASMTKEQLAAAKNEIQRQSDLAAGLNHQLQAAQVDKRVAVEKIAIMQQQVQAERAEKARLAEGFKALATNSSVLTREIRENRALAPNAIFSGFVSSRLQASFEASRAGSFGIRSSSTRESKTLLVSDGTNIYALCHVQDTPLKLFAPGTDWSGLAGTLGRDAVQVPIHALSFHAKDPRIVFMPVSRAEAARLGGKIYPIASDPYKFQDAVLIGTQEDYYGQCSFLIELNTPQYVKLDRNLLKGLFGKFNPSRGDLVFSRNDELLGIMANPNYCLVLHDFGAMATFTFGPDVLSQHTGETLSRLYNYAFNLPLRLQ